MMDKDRKVLVMEVGENHAIVSTSDFQVEEVELSRLPQGVTAGDQVDLSVKPQSVTLQEAPRKRFAVPPLMLAAAAALIALLVFIPSLLGPGEPVPVAMAVLDINPSITLEMDSQGSVLKVHATEEKGNRILEDLDFRLRSLEAVVEDILLSAWLQGFFDPASVESGVFLSLISLTQEEETSSLEPSQLESQLLAAMETWLSGPPGAMVKAWTLDRSDLERARGIDISPNRLMVAGELREAGIEVDEEELRDRPLGLLVAEKARDRGVDPRDILDSRGIQPGPPHDPDWVPPGLRDRSPPGRSRGD